MLKVLDYMTKKPLIILYAVVTLVVAIFVSWYFVNQGLYIRKLEKTSEYTVIIEDKKFYIPSKMSDFGLSIDKNMLRPIKEKCTDTFLTLQSSYDGLAIYGYNPSNQSTIRSEYRAIGFNE